MSPLCSAARTSAGPAAPGWAAPSPSEVSDPMSPPAAPPTARVKMRVAMNGMGRMDVVSERGLLVAQGFDRVQPRRPNGGIDAEEEADGGGDDEREQGHVAAEDGGERVVADGEAVGELREA